ncbi:MAG: GPW/gp25 family protein [Chitinophagaceae bacterium]
MSTPYGITGRGWSFPPLFRKDVKAVDMLTGTDDINSSLEILLNTTAGERIMQVNYGCDLRELLFEPLTTTLKTFITDKIKTALLFYEPRIAVEKIEMTDDGELEGKVIVDITYKERTTNSRYNYVFDYYKGEATEIKTS